MNFDTQESFTNLTRPKILDKLPLTISIIVVILPGVGRDMTKLQTHVAGWYNSEDLQLIHGDVVLCSYYLRNCQLPSGKITFCY